MQRNDQRVAIALVGLGLVVAGHKLMDAEFGKLGLPHALGAVLVSLALKAT